MFSNPRVRKVSSTVYVFLALFAFYLITNRFK